MSGIELLYCTGVQKQQFFDEIERFRALEPLPAGKQGKPDNCYQEMQDKPEFKRTINQMFCPEREM